MTEKITMEEFETLLGVHGREIGAWPENIRSQGQAIASTKEGEQLLAADNMLAALLSVKTSAETEHATRQDEGAFLERLMDIPDVYHQEQKAEKLFSLTKWRRIFMTKNAGWPASVSLAQQALVFAVALGLGILVGVNSAQPQYDYDEFDISDGWLVSAYNFELDEPQ